MLAEALKYLTTPCPRHLRRMGYLTELIALEARFRRCRSHWQPHLERTRAVITEAVRATEGRDKVVVLGCGILSDIPIGLLCDSFATVQLVDVCFLGQTRKAVRPYPNIHWQTSDITGLARPLDDWLRSGEDANMLPTPAGPGDFPLSGADLVISANVLSQLPLLPLEYLQKKRPQLDEATLFDFAGGIVKRHIEFLETATGSVCLISEIERQLSDGQQVTETEDPLFGVTLDRPGEEWFWEMAPMRETASDRAIINRVKGSVWQS